jgi:hypothetical protein
MHQVRARAEAAGVDIDPSGELQGIEAQMRDLGYEVDPEFMAAGDAYDTNFKADVLDHIQAEGELRVHQQLKPGVRRDGRFISPPQIITIGYSEYWKPEDDGGNAAQLPPAPDSTLPPDATAPAEMARQRAPQPQQTAPVEQEAKAGAAPWELGRASLRSRRVTKAQMLERGADGYLTSAVKLDIPVSKIDGREPVPEMEGGYQPGTPITQPIEVEYNPDTDTYILYSGNHRVRQAEINGQATIPAFVENFDHKAAVEQAYREGKPVPAEVLAEYGLTPQPTQRAKPAPKPASQPEQKEPWQMTRAEYARAHPTDSPAPHRGQGASFGKYQNIAGKRVRPLILPGYDGPPLAVREVTRSRVKEIDVVFAASGKCLNAFVRL